MSDETKTAGRPARALTVALALVSLATIVVAIWLGWVAAVVLPRQDPDHAGLWGFLAAAFVGFSALCAAHLRAEGRSPGLRWSLVAVSLLAVVFGVHAVWHSLEAAHHGTHFEGYLLMIGVLLTAHGSIALAHTLNTGRGSSAFGSPTST